MYEVLHDNMEKIQSSEILEQLNLNASKYFIVSVHREENVDNPNHLKQIVNVLPFPGELSPSPLQIEHSPLPPRE